MDHNRSLLWMTLLSLGTAIIISVAGVIYTGISQEKNNQQWCDLLTPLDNAYTSAVPATKIGKKVAEALHKLHDNFNC